MYIDCNVINFLFVHFHLNLTENYTFQNILFTTSICTIKTRVLYLIAEGLKSLLKTEGVFLARKR